ncbi:MAG TPA: CPBP family intramembrane glutamic endopeptidase [Tepidisphaeraceae bacterium]|nr:CPBP family intramembrane glutamic endopeptidase [Tepidisphaeraceae bacterium]
MSILAQDTPTLIFYAILLTMAAGVAWIAGVFRWRAADGPDRVLPGQSMWGLVAAGGSGFLVWIFAQAAYAVLRSPVGLSAQTQPTAEFPFRPRDIAILSTAPFLIAFVFTLLADRGIGGRGIFGQLGLRPKRLPMGIGAGLIGCLIVLPLVFTAGAILEPIYDHLRYVHPSEHELLRAMGEAPPRIRVLLAFGAIFCAPIWEELLFRGHLQTIIRQSLLRLSFPSPPMPRGFPISVAAAEPAAPPDAPAAHGTPALVAGVAIDPGVASPETEPVRDIVQGIPNRLADPIPFADRGPETGVWQTWVAIVLTSAIFALVHPLWMSPLIFVLALGLGYAYERTGSLWTSITIHAVFNGLETVLFLYVLHGPHA